MCPGNAALSHWLLAFGFVLRQTIVRDQPSFFRSRPSEELPPPASGQKPRAKGQLPSFQDFAYKSHGLKILRTNFFAAPMESRFYGFPYRGAVSHWLLAFGQRSGKPTAKGQEPKAGSAKRGPRDHNSYQRRTQ